MFVFTWITSLALVGALQDPTPPAAPSAKAADSKLPLAVLYAGCPGTEREKNFVAFLRSHFARVESIVLGDVSMDTAAAFDVVVADWKERYKYVDGVAKGYAGGISSWSLPQRFTKPVVMVGAVGGEIVPWSKIGWL
jgi:hypothetical protein